MATTATSPSLPFTPPIQQARVPQFSPVPENVPNVPIQQFQHGYGPPVMQQAESAVPVYQPPYVVYASYGIPHYEGRMVGVIMLH